MVFFFTSIRYFFILICIYEEDVFSVLNSCCWSREIFSLCVGFFLDWVISCEWSFLSGFTTYIMSRGKNVLPFVFFKCLRACLVHVFKN